MCPSAVIIEPRHKLYYEVSGQIMAIFGSITDLVEPLSVDEAFLDVGGAIRRLGPPREIGELIRARVYQELGITASVGIAASKFVAKIASTRCKPDGLLLIRPERDRARTCTAFRSTRSGASAPRPRTCWPGWESGRWRTSRRRPSAVPAEGAGRLRRTCLPACPGASIPGPVTPVRLEKSIGAEETLRC